QHLEARPAVAADVHDLEPLRARGFVEDVLEPLRPHRRVERLALSVHARSAGRQDPEDARRLLPRRLLAAEPERVVARLLRRTRRRLPIGLQRVTQIGMRDVARLTLLERALDR